MTTSPVIDPALLERARPLVADGISKNRLRETLGVRRETAALVHDTLSAEQTPPVPEITQTPAAQVMPTAPTLVPQPPSGQPARRVPAWPILLLALPAFVAIWSGWVDLGRLTGFGVVHPFPGVPRLEEFRLNTAITLPVGLETYAAYALGVWMSPNVPGHARAWARGSAIFSLCIGAAGQGVYHLMIASGMGRAPWPVTVLIAWIPVTVLGLGAYLWHLVHKQEEE